MSDRRSSHTPGANPPTANTQRTELSQEQLARMANLIASGEAAFPEDLEPLDRERLETQVRKLLKSRLLVLIARAIAQDIIRNDAEKRVAP